MWGRAEFRGAVLALSGVLALILIITSISPGLPGELLLQTLRFHLVGLGVIFAVLLFMLGARWRALLFVGFLAVALAHGIAYIVEYGGRRTEPTTPLKAELTLLNFNVLAGNNEPERVVEFIRELAPDIALIMETPGVERFIPQIEEALPYRIGCEMPRNCDISLFSRFPIVGGEVRELPPFRRMRLALAPIEVNGVAVTVVGVHLSKPYFDEASSEELWRLQGVLREIEGPIILSGDFNTAIWSGPMGYFGRTVGLIPAPRYPPTWPVELGPVGVPIDNVFTIGSARIEDIEAGEDSFGSNHRYLVARIGLY